MTTRNGDKIYKLFKSIDINLLKLDNKTEFFCFIKKKRNARLMQ